MAKVNVYREAAKSLSVKHPHRWACACGEIWDAGGITFDDVGIPENGKNDPAEPFAAFFTPDDSDDIYWLAATDDENNAQAHEHRILALCFAAAMHDTGDL